MAGSSTTGVIAGITANGIVTVAKFIAAVMRDGKKSVAQGLVYGAFDLVEEPLAEGVEFTILEQRPGWWRVELADGTTGWISETDASTI
mgnify:CR=1 FL=1